MRVHVLGVRGSTPAPGNDFAGYGGHTSCLAVSRTGAPPTLVLDAGTGIRRLGELLAGHAFHGSVLLGHLHWDHTQGLPFCSAADRDDAVVSLYAPEQEGGEGIEAVLARSMSPPHFPITPAGLRGQWRFCSLAPGEHQFEGFNVLALEIPHKGGRTFGYRISDGTSVLAYLSDHWPTKLGPGPDGLGEYHEAARRLTEAADVVFHDAQYRDEELPTKGSFGHSSTGYAVALATIAQAKRVVFFHHDPSRTDAEVASIASAYRHAPLPVEAAREGSTIDLA